jgi:hypothetical protein
MTAPLAAGLACIALVLALPARAQEAPLRSFELAIEHGLVPIGARAMRVAKGNRVRLRITSDRAGEVQLPGYMLEAKLEPGKAASLAFTANATGTYPLYWQAENAAGGKAGKTNNVPLATLEVRVR